MYFVIWNENPVNENEQNKYGEQRCHIQHHFLFCKKSGDENSNIEIKKDGPKNIIHDHEKQSWLSGKVPVGRGIIITNEWQHKKKSPHKYMQYYCQPFWANEWGRLIHKCKTKLKDRCIISDNRTKLTTGWFVSAKQRLLYINKSLSTWVFFRLFISGQTYNFNKNIFGKMSGFHYQVVARFQFSGLYLLSWIPF